MHNPFAEHADDYDQWFDHHPNIFASEVNALKALTSSGLHAVEIGVGSGRFAQALGVRVGVEPVEAMAAMARWRGVNVWPGYAEALPFPDRSFQLALMVTVDCFLSSIPDTLREVNRVLTQNGQFVVAFLDRMTPLGQFYQEVAPSSVFFRDARFHSAAEIRALLEENGFTVTDAVQTVFTQEDVLQEVRPGTGEGVFAVLRAQKQ